MPQTAAYKLGYHDGLEQRLRPYELGSSIAAFDWNEYDAGRKAGERDRQSRPSFPSRFDYRYDHTTGRNERL